MEETIEIVVKGWDKYNPRKDVKHHSWFRLQNSIFEDHELFLLSPNEMAFLVYVFCLASKKNCENVIISIPHAIKVGRFDVKTIDRALEKLHSAKIVIISETSRIRTHPIRIRTLQTNKHYKQTLQTLHSNITNKHGSDIAFVENTNIFDFKNQAPSTWLFEFSRSEDSQKWEELIQNAFENKAPPEILKLTAKLAWLYRTDLETFRADLNDLLSAKLNSEENRRKYLAVCLKKKLGLIAAKAAG